MGYVPPVSTQYLTLQRHWQCDRHNVSRLKLELEFKHIRKDTARLKPHWSLQRTHGLNALLQYVAFVWLTHSSNNVFHDTYIMLQDTLPAWSNINRRVTQWKEMTDAWWRKKYQSMNLWAGVGQSWKDGNPPKSPWHSKSPDKLIQMDLCVIARVVPRRWQGSKIERLVQNRGVESAATDTDGAAHHSRHGEDSQQDSPPVSLQGQTHQTTVEQLSSHGVFLHYSSLDYCWLYFLARCLATYLEKFPSWFFHWLELHLE